MKNDQRGFDNPIKAWNDRFNSEEYIFGKEPNAYLASHASLLKPGQRVLLVADGEGRNGVWCAQRGMKVDAFDLSPVGIDKARQLAVERGVEVNFQVCSSEEWNWVPNVYDAVILIFAHFAVSEGRSKLFSHCVETLKPGGLLIVQGYSIKQLAFRTGGPQEEDLLYTEDWLRNACATMDIIECRSYEAAINEGTRHVGMSALCGVVARKQFV